MAYNPTDWGSAPLSEVNMNKIEQQLVKLDILNVTGTVLSSGADLDDITTPGIYYSDTAAKSASLVNSPITTNAFKLIVEHLASVARIKQTIYANNVMSTKYTRTKIENWGPWKKDIIARVLYEDSNGSSSGNITLSDSIANFDEIEILYAIQNYHKSVKIPVRSTSMSITLDGLVTGSSNLILGSQICSISGTSLTRGSISGKLINLSSNVVSNYENIDIKIYEIIGY